MIIFEILIVVLILFVIRELWNFLRLNFILEIKKDFPYSYMFLCGLDTPSRSFRLLTKRRLRQLETYLRGFQNEMMRHYVSQIYLGKIGLPSYREVISPQMSEEDQIKLLRRESRILELQEYVSKNFSKED